MARTAIDAPGTAVPWRRRVAAAGTVLALSAGMIGLGVVSGTVGTVGAAELPTCAPGQEAVTAAGTGTPAPLGNLTGMPADLSDGGVFDGIAVDGKQLETAATIVAVGRQMGITDRGIRVGIAVAAQQSSLRADAVNGDWLGLFQQNPVEYTQYQRTDPAGATWMFFQRLLAVDPDYDTDTRTDWEIGDLVQLTTTGYRFEPYQGMAAAMVEQLKGSVALAQDDAVCVPAATSAAAQSGSVFDPGNIVSDEVFYNTGAMSVEAIRAFIDRQGENCSGTWCLKNLRVTSLNQPADAYCQAYTGGVAEDAATVIAKVSTACGINPQVMLVTLQKESGLLDRTTVDARSYDAAWGWHCPDTGPGGSANCDPQYAGFFNQAYGMAKQWSRYKVDPGKYNYQAGETVDILWNVAETGCGSAPVTIKNQATASLYNYTPYQPNAAALAAYPGTGDKCSAYGNRNFFYLFRTYFGSTGGGSTSAALATGPTLTIPRSPYVSAALAGQTITAPNAQVAKGLAAGFAALGLPYVWGGGGSGAGANNGCARGGGQFNSCGATVGFDCSGLTAYVLGQAGFTIPGDSGSQRASARTVSWAEAQPGDVVGFPGHVAVYLGTFGGRPYILEASWVGTPVHIVPLTRTDVDPRLYRFWDGPSSGTPVGGAGGTPVPGGTTPEWAAGLAAAGQAVSDAVARTGTATALDPQAGSTTRPATDGGAAVASVRWIPRINPLPYPTSAAGPAVTPDPFPAPVTEPAPQDAPPPAPAVPTSATAPTASAPGSDAPTSSAPTAAEPSTSAPTTSAPSTSAPTTSAPVTTPPSSSAPPSSAPPSSAPSSSAPVSTAPSGTASATTAPTTAASAPPTSVTSSSSGTTPTTGATTSRATSTTSTAAASASGSGTVGSTSTAVTTPPTTGSAAPTTAGATPTSAAPTAPTAATTAPSATAGLTTSTLPTTTAAPASSSHASTTATTPVCPTSTTSAATSSSTVPTPVPTTPTAAAGLVTTTATTPTSAPVCGTDGSGPVQDRAASAGTDHSDHPAAPASPKPTGGSVPAALPAKEQTRRSHARRS